MFLKKKSDEDEKITINHNFWRKMSAAMKDARSLAGPHNKNITFNTIYNWSMNSIRSIPCIHSMMAFPCTWRCLRLSNYKFYFFPLLCEVCTIWAQINHLSGHLQDVHAFVLYFRCSINVQSEKRIVCKVRNLLFPYERWDVTKRYSLIIKFQRIFRTSWYSSWFIRDPEKRESHGKFQSWTKLLQEIHRFINFSPFYWLK